MIVLIDNGHGVETAGKRSPDGSLREYRYTRVIADRIVAELKALGINTQRIVPEEEDVSLRERCRRVNAICNEHGKKNVLLVSVHCNAAGADGSWKTARGWSAHVSKNASSKSKSFARMLINAAEAHGQRVRRYSPPIPFWEQNLAICRDTYCAAVLTENLFQDNREDVAYLLSEEGKQIITDLHVDAILQYIKTYQP